MTEKNKEYLSKREAQIMEVIYRHGSATAALVYEEVEEIPSYSSARVLMHLLADKGMLRHERQGQRYLYFPTTAPEEARRTELNHLMTTFFSGSVAGVMADLIDMKDNDVSDEDWENIHKLIEQARKQGK
jgi:BlaI family penicillinase repressor